MRKLETLFRNDVYFLSGGGGGSDSDFRWGGRRPDEEKLQKKAEYAFHKELNYIKERLPYTREYIE